MYGVEMKIKTRFSLILCTLGDFIEIKKFIQSILPYDKQYVELIVVDQNECSISSFFDPLRSCGFEVKYFHVNFKGLSKARNYGLKYVTGELVAFPDDDCIYQNNLLLEVDKLFKNDISFLSVNTCDQNEKNKSLVVLPKDEHEVSFRSRSAVSFTLFFKHDAIEKIGFFDEKMGVGAGTKYGAGEESDYIVRALKLNLKGIYYPSLYVYHPAKESSGKLSRELKTRMISYGGGYGYFIRKNFLIQGVAISLRAVLGVFFRIIRTIKSPVERKMSIYFFVGFLNGFLKR